MFYIDILLSTCLLAVGLVAGFLFPVYAELRRSRLELNYKVKEFDEITRKAAEANNSLAQKLLQIDEKVINLEFWRQSSITSSPSAFKVK